MNKVMTAQQAATEYFSGNISYWKLLALAKQRKIPHIRIGGRVFFREDSLDTWLTDNEKAIKEVRDNG
ncbi:MAG: helix-turn-helix domain-containing protein [Negativicutes bacterium]|nr:helix-turn-helix domain-containing protein [Negativicutes bacterium]